MGASIGICRENSLVFKILLFADLEVFRVVLVICLTTGFKNMSFLALDRFSLSRTLGPPKMKEYMEQKGL